MDSLISMTVSPTKLKTILHQNPWLQCFPIKYEETVNPLVRHGIEKESRTNVLDSVITCSFVSILAISPNKLSEIDYTSIHACDADNPGYTIRLWASPLASTSVK